MFSENLLQWYKVYKRDLPWRQESDPYKIWISEVVLQQTRVEQGIKYYQRFTEKYPTVFELAKADDDEILLMWQGLGYYNRALNLLRGAKEIVTRFNGVFPKTAAELKTIRGIGDYTAAAIASIAYNEPLAAIDGNLKRIFSRIGAVEISINSKNFQNTISGEIARVFNFSKAGECNQALMDLGAIVCTPRKPKCMDCPLLAGCFGKKLAIA